MLLRAILFLAGGLLLGWPAAAEEEAPAPGRYQFAPDGDGFVRLDTEIGTIAHCGKSESGWRCDVVADDGLSLDHRIVALQQELAALEAELEDLRERLAVLEDDGDATEAAPPVTHGETSEEEEEREFDEALSFAERMMQRFFDMIRELKDEEPPEQI
jgi:hypothetical protein